MPELLPDAAAPRRAGPAGAGPAPGMSVLGRPEVCRAAGRRETTPRAITNGCSSPWGSGRACTRDQRWSQPDITLQSAPVSLRSRGGAGEAVGRREGVVDGAVRTRPGPGVGGVGASVVAGVLAGRPDPGSVDGPGGRVGHVPGGGAAAVRGPAVRPQ